MDIEIRPITPEEYGDFAVAAESAFGHQPKPEELEIYRKIFEFERSLAAFEAGTIVATAGAQSLPVTVPGGKLPMAGVTAVAVRPTHRRRGLLTMLMRRQLDDVRDAGELLAGLWASEGAIYQRFGYGLSTLLGRFEIDRSRTAFARPVQWEGSVRQVVRDDAMALFPPVHERVVERYPGMIGRTKAHWEHDYADLERNRDGAGPLFFAVYESHEGAEGYVAYRVKAEGPRGSRATRSTFGSSWRSPPRRTRLCGDSASTWTSWGPSRAGGVRPRSRSFTCWLIHGPFASASATRSGSGWSTYLQRWRGGNTRPRGR